MTTTDAVSPRRAPAARGLATTVVACAAGAGLALFAVTRVWRNTVQVRASPLPPIHASHTGTSSLGWLSAIALVALAGAGALLATRGGVRVLLGAALGLVGLAVLGGGIDGLRYADGARLVWPVLVALGGVAVAWGGLQTMRHGPSWPAMGAKYERPAGAPGRNRPATEATMWDDLDRGIDPTNRDH